jgi:hypothetical protein
MTAALWKWDLKVLEWESPKVLAVWVLIGATTSPCPRDPLALEPAPSVKGEQVLSPPFIIPAVVEPVPAIVAGTGFHFWEC